MTPGDSSQSAFRVLHLEGWTVVGARRDPDDEGMSELDELLGTLVGPIVVDLGNHVLVEAQRRRFLGALSLPEGAAPRPVVVSSHAVERDALRALGLPQVYESLDAALGVTGAAILGQEDRAGTAILPAASDVETVAAQDLLGGSELPTA